MKAISREEGNGLIEEDISIEESSARTAWPLRQSTAWQSPMLKTSKQPS